MKGAFLVVAWLFHSEIGPVKHFFTPPLALALVAVGLSLGLAGILWALRNAPEGYEDEKGFHFKQGRPRIRRSPGVAILRPHNAG